jgi:hypothetical protein
VDVGGWNPKFWSQNPPPEMLEPWARNEAMFNLYLASQMPQVRITAAAAKPAGDGAFEVSMTVTNEGGMPTALEIAKRVKIVREDTVAIEYGAGQTVTRTGETGGGRGGGGRGGGGRGGGQAGGAQTSRQAQNIGWLDAGETRTFSWTVRGTGPVTLQIASTRGGTDARTISVR